METQAGREYSLNRESSIRAMAQIPQWDCLVVGGGATGLGVAVDAASRGYKTLLVEQTDFAKGTSSRSTKLVHGGVRYLAQGDISLVFEALKERGRLLKNAPHLVRIQSFVIPSYSTFNKFFYGVGLTVYDWMAGRFRFQKTSWLGRKSVMNLLPNIEKENLKGGIEYFDGQFDDARLAINLAQTCTEKGGVVVNYMKVTGLQKNSEGKVTGVKALDLESGQEWHLNSKVVINATGVFVDDMLQMDKPAQAPMIRPSQGVHLVLDKSFMTGTSALMIPKTPDGRVLFAVPWHNHLLVGTTDTPLEESSLEPKPLEEEINFILETAGQYLDRKPRRQDVLSLFAGLRPLAAPTKDTGNTKEISRSHKLMVANSGLITITGGKWTTYRRMAEDTLEAAIKVGNLEARPCITADLKIHGHTEAISITDHLKIYGTDSQDILNLVKADPQLGEKLHPKFPNIRAEVVWSIRHEMARTIEDVLARRLRILFLDAKAAIDMALEISSILASELGRNAQWQQQQLAEFTQLANGYLLQPYNPAFVTEPTEKKLIYKS